MPWCREDCGTVILDSGKRRTLGFPYLLDFCLRNVEIIELSKRNSPTRGRNYWWGKKNKKLIKTFKAEGVHLGFLTNFH